MRTIPLTIAILMFSFVICSAQITGPEQDCIGAIPLCNTVYTQATSYAGTGTVEDIKDGSSCLENEENNSVWFIFEIADSGVLEFTIASIFHEPDDTIDYDFSLFDITGKTCADLYNGGLEVRCNYSFTDSLTGLRTGDTATVGTSRDHHPFLAPLQVTPGQTFALLVDNSSSTTFGFILDFSASTTSFVDQDSSTSLTVSNFQVANDSIIEVHLSRAMRCASIAADGSDFSITGPTSISVISASSCNAQSLTQTVFLRYTGQLLDGETYTLTTQTGSDNNSLLTMCGSVVLTSTDFVASDSLISSTVRVFNDAKIQLFPNPTSGKVLLKAEIPSLAGMESLSIKLYDAMGRQVMKQIFNGSQLLSGIPLDLKELPGSIFFLNVSTEAGSRVMKVGKY